MSELGARMAADMAAQPATLSALVEGRSEIVHALRAAMPRGPAGAVICARGSSDYAAIFGRYVLEQAMRRPVALAAPSLTTLYGVDLNLRDWIAVGVSQSGRTPEVRTVLSRYAMAGACTVAVTNDPESPLAEAADVVVELGTGPETSVPATKTFTAQLLAFALIAEALDWGGFANAHWRVVPAAVSALLDDPEPAERVAERLDGTEGIACVARGYLLCIALEAALKLREAARVRAEGWSAADFRHGPVTMAGAGLPVLAVSVPGPAAADVAALADALANRGAPVFRLHATPDADLPLASSPPEPLAVVPAAVRAQQLALALALRRGVDPDRPPGLAKVTPTV